MNNFYGCHYLKGFKVDFYGFDRDKDSVLYEVGGKCRRAKRHYVCPFGGNPFPNTIIEWYEIILPTGAHARLNIYA